MDRFGVELFPAQFLPLRGMDNPKHFRGDDKGW